MNGLAEWLRCWIDVTDPIELCRMSYQERKSDFMRLLAELGMEPSYKSNRDAIHRTFSLVRHYIGRLGHHFRIAKDLLSCAPRLSNILHNFEVRSVAIPPRSAIPPADDKTRLDSVIVRMLPAKSPDLDRYQQNIAEMDAKYQLSRRFLNNYREPGLKPRVHAEVQVLEHFYTRNLNFADCDPYVSCSKPACFCCLLYFRAHPGKFVEPTSHHKIYLNWRPPDLSASKSEIGENHQRDILNTMTQAIRKEALKQIDEKIPPCAWHPDSITGITEATGGELTSTLEDSEVDVLAGGQSERNPELCALGSEPSVTGVEGADAIPDRREDSLPLMRTFDVFLDDSDVQGGVPLHVSPFAQ